MLAHPAARRSASAVANGGGYLLARRTRPASSPTWASPPTPTGAKSTTGRLLHHALALMVGTAGLPHVIVRFFTVPQRARCAHLGGLGPALHRHCSTPPPPRWARWRASTSPPRPCSRAPWAPPTANLAYAERPRLVRAPGRRPSLLALRGSRTATAASSTTTTPNPAFAASAPKLALAGRATSSTVDRDIIVLANPEIAGLPELGDRVDRRGRHCHSTLRLRQACCS